MNMCPSVNNIYVMYIMLCESLISMLLLFKSTYIYIYIYKGLKSMDKKIIWTQRCNVNKLSKKQGILVQGNDEVKTLVSMDKTK